MEKDVKKSPKARRSKMKRAIPEVKPAPERTEKASPTVPPHKHCYNCGVSMDPKDELCSDKCRTEWERMIKRKKYWTYLPLIGIAFIILIYILLTMG